MAISSMMNVGNEFMRIGDSSLATQGLLSLIMANLAEKRASWDAADAQTNLMQDARDAALTGYDRQGERYGAANEAIFGDEDSQFSRQQDTINNIGNIMGGQVGAIDDAMQDAATGREEQMAAENASNRVPGQGAFSAAMNNARKARKGRARHRAGLTKAAFEQSADSAMNIGDALGEGRYRQDTARRRSDLEADLGALHRQAGGLRQGLLMGYARQQRPEWDPLTGVVRRFGIRDLNRGLRG